MNGLKVICYEEEGERFNLQRVASFAYKRLNQTQKLAIEVAFVSPEEIRSLNLEQRNIDSVTDVLSFPYLDGIRYKVLEKGDFSAFDEEEDGYMLGSICICLERAKEQAKEYGHSLEREVCYLTLHGILHCFGYDHITPKDDEEMTALAEEIMNGLNLKRN